MISALNELHQRATSAIHALQQGSSNSNSSSAQQPQSRAVGAGIRRGSSQRVHFAPPFASLSPLGRAGGAKAGDSLSKKQKKQQEEEERILISEVGTAGGLVVVLVLQSTSKTQRTAGSASLYSPH